ncbi:hypothetical protein [Halomonas citrativorans]|uniref:hypothetical protein n=1 Tax=Halomonas citrativorans TaxID=2742612 RepID=UPI000B35A153|nr:hypothetical protein [Halomonas citrativorans]
MPDTSTALFQQMKLTILLTAQDGAEESPFHPAYLHAWDDGVYPLLDDGVDWHRPHAEQFTINKEKVQQIFSILCDYWEEKKELTFYTLEDQLGIKGSAYSLGDFERHDVISICRYFYLHDRFDKDFWSVLCRNGDCPSEAHVIASDRQVDIYFN